MKKSFTHNGYTATYRRYSRTYNTWILISIVDAAGRAVRYDQIFTGHVGSAICGPEREVIEDTKWAIDNGFPTKTQRRTMAMPSDEIDLF